MLGRFRRIFRDGDNSSAARWAAGSLALVSAFGTLASLMLWIEIGVIGAAIGFATTTATIYIAMLFLLKLMVPGRSRDGRADEERASARDTKEALSSHR